MLRKVRCYHIEASINNKTLKPIQGIVNDIYKRRQRFLNRLNCLSHSVASFDKDLPDPVGLKNLCRVYLNTQFVW